MGLVAGERVRGAGTRRTPRRRARRPASGGATTHQYLYGSRQPLREEIIRYLGDDGRGYAIITRNRYGALVLNTAQVPFWTRWRRRCSMA